MSVGNNLITPQNNKPVMGIVQDALLACYLMTAPGQFCERARAFDLCMWVDSQPPPPDIVKPRALWSGATLLSMVFPADFDYEDDNVVISGGYPRGRLCKKSLGPVENGVIHKLHHDYGAARVAKFMSQIQILANNWMLGHSFSIGIADCCPSTAHAREARATILAEVEACGVPWLDEDTKSDRLNAVRDRAAGAIVRESETNAFGVMMNAGSKGS